MSKPLIQDIGHVIIGVRDMREALEFYRDILGFKVVGSENPVWTVVEAPGGQLTLYKQKAPVPLALGPKGQASPFTFHVEDFAAVATILESKGVRLKRQDEHSGVVWDPFGNVLGLHDHREV